MTIPSLGYLTDEEALEKLHKLESSVEGTLKDFEERAYSYNLTPREFAIWEQITELRWLLGRR